MVALPKKLFYLYFKTFLNMSTEVFYNEMKKELYLKPCPIKIKLISRENMLLKFKQRLVIMSPKLGMEEIRREQVIKGAKLCILEKGLHDFSVKEIANKAGVSTGIIYHYFKNKDDLLAHVLREVFQKTHQSVTEKVDSIQDFEEKLRTYLFEIAQIPINNEEFYPVFMNYLGLASYRRDVHIITQRFISNIQQYIQGIIALGIEQGKVTEEKSKILAPIITSLTLGISAQWTLQPKSYDIDEANRIWIQMVMDYVKE